jgi:hypothetical protein
MWSVGLAVSGNEFGATWEEYQTMSKEDQSEGELTRLRPFAFCQPGVDVGNHFRQIRQGINPQVLASWITAT